MKVRKAFTADALGIAKVQVDTWNTTYRGIVPDVFLDSMTYESREHKWKEILSQGATVYVAESEGICGFASAGTQRSNKYPAYEGELYAIYVNEENQRRGVGKGLLEPVVKELVKQKIFAVTVVVLQENPSRYFYEFLGARIIDTIETEIAGKRIPELVYGWKDIREILIK
ncbi:N-acetyltransferase [Bacillus salacetis]|uniref:N-acetyltransferase n=1 Tax=Bacillus salacetis TaxID=2315464 RepID=A0A3A1R005_9BACI|nr:GNAT family N-acetyltransferase [Bacillus salacetis]RIW34678.1 N-acetyltransferase [Bacillus salacetis]